jgi:hypothetical protein
MFVIKLRQVRTIIRTAAPSDASVLIEGELGTGKELIATGGAGGKAGPAPFTNFPSYERLPAVTWPKVVLHFHYKRNPK